MNFNLLIVMAPVSQIEYVVVHMPDYELRKDSLRRDGWKYAL